MNSLLWGPYLSSTYIGLPPLFSQKCLALDVRSLCSKLKTYLLPLRMDGVARHRVGRSEDRLERCGSPSRISEKPSGLSDTPPHHTPGMPDRVGLKRFADRFLRKGKRKIGICESLYNIATSSCTCHFPQGWGSVWWMPMFTHFGLENSFESMCHIHSCLLGSLLQGRRPLSPYLRL